MTLHYQDQNQDFTLLLLENFHMYGKLHCKMWFEHFDTNLQLYNQIFFQ